MTNYETVTVETDLLILGGGMAACGAAIEASYWAKKHGIKITLVDKAAMDRSGAVAMGLSAINQYVGLKDGKNTIQDYVNYDIRTHHTNMDTADRLDLNDITQAAIVMATYAYNAANLDRKIPHKERR